MNIYYEGTHFWLVTGKAQRNLVEASGLFTDGTWYQNDVPQGDSNLGKFQISNECFIQNQIQDF